MFEVVFLRVTLSKPNRYVFLLKTHNQTKRTDVCQEWTSSPQFHPIAIEELSMFQLKLCEAGLDKKVRIVGGGSVSQQVFDLEGDVAFEGEIKLQQEVEGKQVCFGLAHLRVCRQKQYEAIPEGRTKQLKTEVSRLVGQEEDEDFQLDAQRESNNQSQDEEEDEDLLRVEVHCGFNFYIGSQFFVQTVWGRSIFRSRSIKDKISPLWAQGGRVSGKPSKPIIINVKDSKGNILESFKFSLSSLRTLFPYHLRMIFRQEYLGATPELLFSLVRESQARHSITELPLRFGLRNVGEPVRNAMYLMLSLSPYQRVPNFMTLDRSQRATLQQANTFLTSRTVGEQERVQLVGLCNNQTPKGFSIFKSYLSRKIFMQLLMVPDAKSWFSGGNLESARVVEARADLEVVLKKVYYQGQAFTIKKMLEFFNPNTIQTADTEAKSVAQRWKLLTRSYILRNKMVNQSTKHISKLKQAIEMKGAELVQIKKILNEIKLVNFSLVGKEKLINAIKNRTKTGQNMYAKEIDKGGLISALYEKQAILESQKRINAELAIRMDSLTSVEQNQTDLQRHLTDNASKLLQQQSSISKMKKMQQAIKHQRMIIGQLQRSFEKGEMDKRVNEALKQQRERLQQLRQKKEQDLMKVYRIVKENNQHTSSLLAKVKHAEGTLVKLNEQYARLTTL